MFDSKILLPAICGSSLDYPRRAEPAHPTGDAAPLPEASSCGEDLTLLSSPQILWDGDPACSSSSLEPVFPALPSCAPEHPLVHMECGMGKLSGLGKSCSSNSSNLSRAGLGQVAEVCLPLVHQGPDSIHQSKHSLSFLQQRTGTGHSTGHPLPRKGSAPASLEMGAGKWRKPCLDHKNSSSGNSLRNVSVLKQKKASSVGIIPQKVQQEGAVAGLAAQQSACVSCLRLCWCSVTSLESSAVIPVPTIPSEHGHEQPEGKGWRSQPPPEHEHLHSQSLFSACNSKRHQK